MPGLNLDEWAMCDPDQSYIRAYVLTRPQGGGGDRYFVSFLRCFSLRRLQRMSVASSSRFIGYPTDATYLSYEITVASSENRASDPHRCSERGKYPQFY